MGQGTRSKSSPLDKEAAQAVHDALKAEKQTAKDAKKQVGFHPYHPVGRVLRVSGIGDRGGRRGHQRVFRIGHVGRHGHVDYLGYRYALQEESAKKAAHKELRAINASEAGAPTSKRAKADAKKLEQKAKKQERGSECEHGIWKCRVCNPAPHK